MWVFDERISEALAARLRELRPSPEYFLPPSPPGASPDQTALAWMILVGICQQTRTLQGRVAGRWYRGSDYLFQKGLERLARRPEDYSCERLLALTEADLLSWFSDDGDPSCSTLDRVEERLRLLKGIAEWLLREYQGKAMILYQSSGGRVEDAPETAPSGGAALAQNAGLQNRLAQCEAYSDPLAKKTFLLLLDLDALRIWPLKDAHALHIPVDYHIMRILLRAGAVAPSDPAMYEKLRRDQANEASIEEPLRAACRAACRWMVREGNCPLFILDAALWMIGRNCCFYEHEPYCHPGLAAGGASAGLAALAECPARGRCSLRESFLLECENLCPLDGICSGSRDPQFRGLKEPGVQTHYY